MKLKKLSFSEASVPVEPVQVRCFCQTLTTIPAWHDSLRLSPTEAGMLTIALVQSSRQQLVRISKAWFTATACAD